jgi:hypothetical protein
METKRRDLLRWEDGFAIEKWGHVGWFGVDESGDPMVQCCTFTHVGVDPVEVVDEWRDHVHG